MDFSTKRRLARFMGVVEPLSDALGLLLTVLFFIRYLPVELLGSQPATGGDMGSHYWPLYTMANHGLPEWRLRVWNPGNLAGEPQLIHYFPLPFLVMTFLSYFIPLGMAFNFGTLLPLLLMPICAYVAIRGIGLRFPAPLIGAMFSLCFLYNESFSMWGGNTLSTLAGQFAHVYALDFYLLGIGALVWELRTNRVPIASTLAFAGVALSHAFVEVVVPFGILAVILFSTSPSLRNRLKIGAISGGVSLLLSAWFLVPMVDTQRWMTAVPMSWKGDPQLLSQALAAIFHPILYICLVSTVSLLILTLLGWFRPRSVRSVGIWLLPAVVCFGFFFIFTEIGLVDIRAVPQIQLFACLLSAQLFSLVLSSFGRTFAWIATLPVVFAVFGWVDSHVSNFPLWLQWNYSGWETKALYPDLKRLYDKVRGDYSQPRVVFEHNPKYEAAGTTRVFEMLPYFANRATLESVYLQATLISPQAFHIQAEVSATSSCPIKGVSCPKANLRRALPHLQLLGVGELILSSPEVLGQAREAEFLTEAGSFGMFHLYRLKDQPSLVSVFQQVPQIVDPEDAKAGEKPITDPVINDLSAQMAVPEWHRRFYRWFEVYQDERTPFLLLKDRALTRYLERSGISNLAENIGVWSSYESCEPKVTVDFNTIKLTTPCPGRAHLLKFAYHSTWEADSGDDIFLASPGFLALIPSKNEVTLTFGKSNLWRFFDYVSLITALCILSLGLFATWSFVYSSRHSRSRKRAPAI